MQTAGIAPATAVFESLTPAILAIDPAGIARPLQSGEARVRISSPSGANATTLTVDVELPRFAVPGSVRMRSAAAVMPGGTVTLLPYFDVPNVNPASVQWSSSHPDIAAVDGNGVVTGLRAGTATITMTVTGTTLQAACRVTVAAGNGPTSISLNRTSLSLNAGRTFNLTVTYRPNNAQGRGVTWISSDENVARVNPGGQVTASGTGRATITAICDISGVRASCEVTVTVPVTGVSLNQTAVTLKVGERSQLIADVSPAGASNQGVTWRSSNPRVAAVDAHGNVTAVGAGTATITVTTAEGRRTATARITVQR
jgi:uncharacterized protein YjdB